MIWIFYGKQLLICLRMIIQRQEEKWQFESLLCSNTAKNWEIVRHINIFEAVEVTKKKESEYPRKYQDYIIQIHEEMIPDSVEMKRMI